MRHIRRMMMNRAGIRCSNYLSSARMGVKFCDEYECLSVYSHNAKITQPNFTKFLSMCLTIHTAHGGRVNKALIANRHKPARTHARMMHAIECNGHKRTNYRPMGLRWQLHRAATAHLRRAENISWRDLSIRVQLLFAELPVYAMRYHTTHARQQTQWHNV